jgi:hypothetical protein
MSTSETKTSLLLSPFDLRGAVAKESNRYGSVDPITGG